MQAPSVKSTVRKKAARHHGQSISVSIVDHAFVSELFLTRVLAEDVVLEFVSVVEDRPSVLFRVGERLDVFEVGISMPGLAAVPVLRARGSKSEVLPTFSRLILLDAADATLTTPVRRAAEAIPMRCEIVAIGVSTGGPTALLNLLPRLPSDFPLPVVIVQHMPPVFTRQLAERLNTECAIRVLEAEEGMALEPGIALLAPGGRHMRLKRGLHAVQVTLDDGERENSCRPAVDVLFRSVAATYGSQALAVILTGMGHDGLRGAESLKREGGYVIAQDRASSVVWGMPGAVVAAGLADAVLNLDEIASAILRRVTKP